MLLLLARQIGEIMLNLLASANWRNNALFACIVPTEGKCCITSPFWE